MTKKDYELFANEFNKMLESGVDQEAMQHIVSAVSRVFEEDNSNFKRDKFEEAVFTGKHIRKSISGRV